MSGRFGSHATFCGDPKCPICGHGTAPPGPSNRELRRRGKKAIRTRREVERGATPTSEVKDG